MSDDLPENKEKALMDWVMSLRPADSPHWRKICLQSPQITVDLNRCPGLDECHQCLTVCNTRVLAMLPITEGAKIDHPKEGRSNRHPFPFRPDLCLGVNCRRCQTICPHQAIVVEPPLS